MEIEASSEFNSAQNNQGPILKGTQEIMLRRVLPWIPPEALGVRAFRRPAAKEFERNTHQATSTKNPPIPIEADVPPVHVKGPGYD